MSPAAAPHLALKLPAWRSRLLLLLLLAWFVALGGRALYLQGLNNDFLQQKGESRYSRVIELMPTRGRIVDRGATTATVELAGDPAAIDAGIERLSPLGVVEMARSGRVSLARGDKTLGQ